MLHLHIELFRYRLYYAISCNIPFQISQRTHSEYPTYHIVIFHASSLSAISRPLLFISDITCITNIARPIYLHYPDVSTLMNQLNISSLAPILSAIFP